MVELGGGRSVVELWKTGWGLGNGSIALALKFCLSGGLLGLLSSLHFA